MKRLVAHSGSPYHLAQFIDGLRTILSSHITISRGEDQLAGMVKRKHCLLTSSGRYALFLILKTIRKTRPGAKVIVPAYTCPSVIRASRRAGFTPVFCDLKEGSFDFNFTQLEELIDAETAAVIAVNLCGLICDFNRLGKITRRRKIILIEDACQSLGGSYHGAPSGSLGDFSFTSFGYSKNLAVGAGGAVFTDDQRYFHHLQNIINPSVGNILQSRSHFIQWTLYCLLLHPRIYYLLRLLPYQFESENFELDPEREGRMPPGQVRLLAALLKYLAPLTGKRRNNSRLLYQKLTPLKNIRLFPGASSPEGAALRFPLLCRDSARRKELRARLKAKGIEADPFYQLKKQKYFADPGRRFAVSCGYAERILTLPTHGYLRGRDREGIATVFSSEEDQK